MITIDAIGSWGVQMKKVLLGSAVALGMSVPAIAADMAVRPIARAVPVTTWTGCYIGGNGGYGFGRSDGYSTTTTSTFIGLTGTTPTAFAAAGGRPLTDSFNMSGLNGGAYGGCQMQFGVWVVGVEGDWNAYNKEGQAFLLGGPGVNTIALAGGGTTTVPAGLYWSAKERWLATARGRLGYAVDKWLFSVSGGAAWVKIDSSEGTTGGAGFVVVPAPITPLAGLSNANIQTDTRVGWTAGAAVEYALPYNWSIKAEYLYVQIPSYTTLTPGTNRFAPFAVTSVDAGKLTNNIVRFGLAYKFFGR
jgi:outer membrane immunogenic protein